MIAIGQTELNPQSPILRLYERTRRNQWQPDDLDWQTEVKLNLKQRKSGAYILSQVLYGEKLSLEVIQQLLPVVQNPEVKLFLQAQAIDELRHIAVFTRYIEQGLEEAVQTPGAALSEIGEGMLNCQSVEEKLLSVHILLEGMALEIFRGVVENIDDALLQTLLRRVARDESRHVAFGVNHVRELVTNMDGAGLERIGQGGARFAICAARMVRDEYQIGADFGIDLRAIQNASLRVLFRRLQQVGLLGFKSC